MNVLASMPASGIIVIAAIAILFVLGGTGISLSFLRSEEKTASAENVRSVLASRAEPQDPAGAWL